MIVIASLRSAQTCCEPSTHNIDVDELNELGIDVPTQLIRKIIRVGRLYPAVTKVEISHAKTRSKINFQTSFAKNKQSSIVPPFARSALGCCEPSTHGRLFRSGAISRNDQSRNKSRKNALENRTPRGTEGEERKFLSFFCGYWVMGCSTAEPGSKREQSKARK